MRDKSKIAWGLFPTDYKELIGAMETIPTVAPHVHAVWKLLAAVLHLGNAAFKGSGDDDAASSPAAPHRRRSAAARLRGGAAVQGAVHAQHQGRASTGSRSRTRPSTRSRQGRPLSKALYSRLFDCLVERINESLIHGGESPLLHRRRRHLRLRVLPANSLEQLCINFANEKLQRMFTEAVFESVLAEYTKEGIDVGGMTFEDNSAVVALIEGSPGGLLTTLSEECFFPNGSDMGFLGKIQEAHRKHPNFEGHVKESKTSFTVVHYPGKVTYDAIGFLEKNKDPLSQDVKVLMQYSDDDFVKELFTDRAGPAAARSSSRPSLWA